MTKPGRRCGRPGCAPLRRVATRQGLASRPRPDAAPLPRQLAPGAKFAAAIAAEGLAQAGGPAHGCVPSRGDGAPRAHRADLADLAARAARATRAARAARAARTPAFSRFSDQARPCASHAARPAPPRALRCLAVTTHARWTQRQPHARGPASTRAAHRRPRPQPPSSAENSKDGQR